MKTILLFVALIFTSMQTYADETTHAVKVECHPYSGHVTAKMINYYGCGDGHCNEKDFAKTEEGKHLKQQGVLLLLPNSTQLTTECKIGESIIKVEVTPKYPRMCDEYASVKIWHNNAVILKRNDLWKNCIGRGESGSPLVEYRADYQGDPQSQSKSEYLGYITLHKINKNGYPFTVGEWIKQKNMPATFQNYDRKKELAHKKFLSFCTKEASPTE